MLRLEALIAEAEAAIAADQVQIGLSTEGFFVTPDMQITARDAWIIHRARYGEQADSHPLSGSISPDDGPSFRIGLAPSDSEKAEAKKRLKKLQIDRVRAGSFYALGSKTDVLQTINAIAILQKQEVSFSTSLPLGVKPANFNYGKPYLSIGRSVDSTGVSRGVTGTLDNQGLVHSHPVDAFPDGQVAVSRHASCMLVFPGTGRLVVSLEPMGDINGVYLADLNRDGGEAMLNRVMPSRSSTPTAPVVPIHDFSVPIYVYGEGAPGDESSVVNVVLPRAEEFSVHTAYGRIIDASYPTPNEFELFMNAQYSL